MRAGLPMAKRFPSPDHLLAHAADRLGAHVVRGQSLCAAYSGGLDSTVLLDLLARLRERIGFALTALHVHHGLSPQADAWARACEATAASLGIALRVERVHVDRDHAGGIEAAARNARHEAFARAQTDFVVLAHHRDDQAETVLLQALRGTGTKGLSAMGERRSLGPTVLLRPLLDVPRAALADYARARSLTWVEDESNALTAFDRNFLRHDVLPLLEGRFPQYRESLARLARHAAAAAAVVEDVAREDAKHAAEGGGLSAQKLGALGEARGANLLRHFLAARGFAMPSERRLAEWLRQLVAAQGDARILLAEGGRAIVRHRGRILVEDAPQPASKWTVRWLGERRLALGEGRGEVRFEEAAGEGIALARLDSGRWHFAPRAGGERIRLRPAAPTRTLKNLLQEHDVPVWRRASLPLLFDGERLVWVPGIGVAADYRPAPGAPGLKPCWDRSPEQPAKPVAPNWPSRGPLC